MAFGHFVVRVCSLVRRQVIPKPYRAQGTFKTGQIASQHHFLCKKGFVGRANVVSASKSLETYKTDVT